MELERAGYVTYRYINHVLLEDAENSIEVNWVQITITNEKGKTTIHPAFITSWQSQLEFMIRGLREGPCPQPDLSSIIRWSAL